MQESLDQCLDAAGFSQDLLSGEMEDFPWKARRFFSQSSTEISHHFSLSVIPHIDFCSHFWAPRHFPALWLLPGLVLGNVLAGNPGNGQELGMGTTKLRDKDFPHPMEQKDWLWCLGRAFNS